MPSLSALGTMIAFIFLLGLVTKNAILLIDYTNTLRDRDGMEMFAALQPAFERLGCDDRYFTEHVAVDTDEHATWMAEAVQDVIDVYGPRCIPEIEAGMTDAFKETLEVPDELWRLRCASL